MTVSIGTIAQQALRRLGVRIVPLDDSPTLTEMVPFADIATAALVELGVLNSDETLGEPIAPAADIVTTALRELGVLNSTDPFTPAPGISLDQIAGAALVELGVIAADEVPSSSDLLLATEKATLVHDGLHTRGITRWSNAAIPASVSEEYIKLTAATAASSFGKAVDPAIVALLEGRVRAAATVLTMTPTEMMGHLEGVHQSLVAKGIALWDINAIPAAFGEEYRKLLVAWLNVTFGRPETDPAEVAALEARIRAGATVLNNNQAFMLDKVASVHASLDAQGVIWWASGSVPRAFAEEYSKLTALYAATSFGKQADPAMIPALEARVRKGAMVLSADDNAQQAVQAVHDDLVMRGIARWTVFDIPQALSDPYVTLAADALAPLFGGDTDPKDTADAMVAIYRYTALPSSGDPVATAYF